MLAARGEEAGAAQLHDERTVRVDENAADGLRKKLAVAIEVAREERSVAHREVFHPRDGGHEYRKYAPLGSRTARSMNATVARWQDPPADPSIISL
jgi:hypothetical protein